MRDPLVMHSNYRNSTIIKPCFNPKPDMKRFMAFERGSMDATLAAAAGEDPALLAELRAVFADSARRQVDLLRRARCDGNWRVAAQRLQGLAASFHAEELEELADEALGAVPGEPGVLRRMDALIDDFAPSTAG